MADIAVCPDRNLLQQLLLGALDENSGAAIEQHLLACEPCCTALHELEASDTLAEVVRAIASEESPLDESMRAVMDRLKEITVPAKALEETLARDNGREQTQDAWEIEKLLDPPEAEGELGRFGGYRVLRMLGAGGMGLVFEAEDPKLRRRVALKVMQRSLAARDEHHQRFLREARATAAIEHPHIVTVYQVGEHRGLPFLAMQLLKGQSLQERLERNAEEGSGLGVQGSSSVGNALRGVPGAAESATAILPEGEETGGWLPHPEVLRIGRETAEALAEAHSRNLIHRDIKPANIWLEGASGWVKLVDFGLAHAAEDVHLTQTGAILGTPAYMSPEQARGDAVDARCDLYSLGAVLYKLTTGEVPFRGATTLAVLMALANDTPRPPRQIHSDVPPALEDLILRLLAKKPEDRPESATAVAEAIREIEDSRSGVAHQPLAGTERSDAPARRRSRWTLVAAAMAAFFALAAIVIVVRDKDGKELFRATVPDGGSATLTEGDVVSKAAPAFREGGATSSPKSDGSSSPRSVEPALPEPPPLEKWLTGRTVLTVAQDGSGKFKSIQAALDALRPGQAVEVLDRGPYREALESTPPADTGLISGANTVVELSLPADTVADSQTPGTHHAFRDACGFRLSGFVFRPVEAERYESYHQTVGVYWARAVVIEKCVFEQPADDPKGVYLWALYFTSGGSGNRDACFVRDSIFNGRMWSTAPVMAIERNWFRGERCDGALHAGGRQENVVIRHNVIDADIRRGIKIFNSGDSKNIQVSNNTLVKAGLVAGGTANSGVAMNVAVRGNLFGGPILFDPSVLDLLSDAARKWQVAQNGYSDREAGQNQLPAQNSEMSWNGTYLSADSQNHDYLRVPADSPAATTDARGEWPGYIGALPPGPAPKDGDWFTRLRERWGNVAPTLRDGIAGPSPEGRPGSPPRSVGATLPEPPPLEEWLKGRTILTVAQDGSGQFKTIQSALKALRPGQVAEVLDRGPYRETLAYRARADTGLISRHGTVIEMPDTVNHVFDNTVGFRLSGFEFVPFEGGYTAEWLNHLGWFFASGVVVEHCYFHAMPSNPPNLFAMQFLLFGEHGGEEPVVIRDCLIEGRIQIRADYSKHEPRLVLQRNWLRPKNFPGAALELHGLCGAFVIRHNVIERGADPAMNLRFHPHLQNPKGVEQIAKHPDGIRLSIENNTLPDSGINIVMWRKEVRATVEARDNLLGGPITFEKFAFNQLAAAKKEWRVEHNFYLRAPKEADEFPLGTTDGAGDPHFANRDEASDDFLRPLADSPLATGGAGGGRPGFIGALSPGPAPPDGDWFTHLKERWVAGTTTTSKAAVSSADGVQPPSDN